MLLLNVFIYLPLCYVSHDFPARMPRRALAFLLGVAKGTPVPLATPNKNVGAQEASGIWVAFSLDTFFWRSKRKYLACQCENWFQKSRRGSDTKVKFHSRNYEC